MFNLFNRSCEERIYSPIVGNTIPLSQVPDEVFSEKMMGEGIGFILKDDTIYSPCDGKIILIASTKHAIGIRTKTGTEILIHIGLETVNLNGKYFNVLVKVGDYVNAHEPIVVIDLPLLANENFNLTTPLIVTNVDINEVEVTKEKIVGLETVVCTIRKK